MTVRSRLLAGFGVAIAIVLLPALFAAERLAELQDLVVEGRSRQADALVSVGSLRTALADLDRFQRGYVATGDVALGAEARDALATIRMEHDALAGSTYVGSMDRLSPLVTELGRAATEVERAVGEGAFDLATGAVLRLDGVLADTETALAAVADSIASVTRRDLERAAALSAASRRATLLGAVLALLIAFVMATWASASLVAPLRRLGNAMARVTAGDLTPADDLPTDRSDEIGELTSSFRVMSERLADLDRLKAEFIGVASHELKTPINAIHGYAELIQEEYGRQAPEEYGRMVDGIAEQARVMARLVDRLMDLSRLETGSYHVQPETVHVEDLVTGVLRAFEILARQRAVRLDATIRPDAPETIVLDLDLIRDEVLGNLVANALRYTPAGGSVRLEVGPAAHGGAVFTVSDTGPGVPESEREMIFRKYYRGESDAPGTGLGLAIARETVLIHGGTITLLPKAGDSGAAFQVVLPPFPPGSGPAPG